MNILGFDIGGTKCAVVLSEKSASSVKDKIRFDTLAGRGWEKVVGELIFSAAEETVGTARRVYEALKRADADCLDVAERIRLSTGAFPEDWKLVPVVMEVKP